MASDAKELLRSWQADDRKLLLQVIQPGLVGLIDGTLSTLAPIFAAAYLSGSRAALLVGLAAALGAGIRMRSALLASTCGWPTTTLFFLQVATISAICSSTTGCSYWRGKPSSWLRSPSPIKIAPMTQESAERDFGLFSGSGAAAGGGAEGTRARSGVSAIGSSVVSVELVTIALIRKRYLQAPLSQSLIQVTLGGALIAVVGFAVGHT